MSNVTPPPAPGCRLVRVGARYVSGSAAMA